MVSLIKYFKTPFIYLVLAAFSCNQNDNHTIIPDLGKYINRHDGSILFLYSDSTYKLIDGDTEFSDKWVFIAPSEIGFKNWQDEKSGKLNYNFGIVRKRKIIFDLDNETNNYVFESQ